MVCLDFELLNLPNRFQIFTSSLNYFLNIMTTCNFSLIWEKIHSMYILKISVHKIGRSPLVVHQEQYMKMRKSLLGDAFFSEIRSSPIKVAFLTQNRPQNEI